MVTLDGRSGLLQWRGEREGQLLVGSDLIGFSSVGSTVHLYTFKMSQTTKMCGKGLPGRKRRDMLMEFDNIDAHKLCCESIQKILDQSGTHTTIPVFGVPMVFFSHFRTYGCGFAYNFEFVPFFPYSENSACGLCK